MSERDSGKRFLTSGIVDTGGKFATVSKTLAKLVAKFAPGVIVNGRWCTLICEYLREFSKKIVTVLMGYSGAGRKLIH
jgi:hypothetical protein